MKAENANKIETYVRKIQTIKKHSAVNAGKWIQTEVNEVELACNYGAVCFVAQPASHVLQRKKRRGLDLTA